ncbi:MAG TPA: hypothetical protein VEP50_14585, partial [bacterium]|nr:hypothetical protein [bacterium]
PRRGKITVHIGQAIVPSKAKTRRDQSALTARVMEAITRLSGKGAAISKEGNMIGLRAAVSYSRGLYKTGSF